MLHALCVTEGHTITIGSMHEQNDLAQPIELYLQCYRKQRCSARLWVPVSKESKDGSFKHSWTIKNQTYNILTMLQTENNFMAKP